MGRQESAFAPSCQILGPLENWLAIVHFAPQLLALSPLLTDFLSRVSVCAEIACVNSTHVLLFLLQQIN